MARIRLDIDTRTLRNGAAQIRLRINHRGTSAYVATGVYIEPQYFLPGSLYDPISRKAPMASVARERVAQIVSRVDEFINHTNRSDLDLITATDIRDRALGPKRAPVASSTDSSVQIINTTKRIAQNGDFVAFFEAYGESRRTAKTQDSYAYAANVLRLYCADRGLVTLTFNDIDYPRLVDYSRWLSQTKSPATRHMLESYVRAAYRDGQKRRLVGRDRDPYFDYSIASVPLKDIECLTPKQMKILMNYETNLKGLQLGRDVALMSFYLCGNNLIDLYEMNVPKDGECVFVRHKIEHLYQREVHIRIEPEFAALVERYKGDGMMLRFKATYPNYESFRHKIGHRLRELSIELGFDVSMPKIRRTWATIAGSLECSDRVIDKSMGHVDKTVKDVSYDKYDWNLTAKWNRKVIDYILSV